MEWAGSRKIRRMSKCLYCHQRKGKRACPALGGVICSQCCGTNRITNISCPTSCVFLESNDDYQQKRVGNRFELERRGFYRQLLDLGGERATEIFYVFEALAYRFFQDRRDAEDAEVLEGLQSLRRSFSLIHIPDAGLPAFGEELRKEFKVFGERQPLEPHAGHQRVGPSPYLHSRIFRIRASFPSIFTWITRLYPGTPSRCGRTTRPPNRCGRAHHYSQWI